MKIDLTIPLSNELEALAKENLKKASAGHLGTHFDVMNKVFPLDYTEREAVVFDVRDIADREIEITDIDLSAIGKDMFVGFCTGYIDKTGYGTKEYFASHPVLSVALIDELLAKKVSVIGIDCAGIRAGNEHTPTDARCAKQDVFVLENLCSMEKVPFNAPFLIHIYPLNHTKYSGLPCRVIAEI